MEETALLPRKARRTLERYEMLSRGQKVLVSVSGGPDSLALLLFLCEIGPEYDLDLGVFHLDHMFRGEESREDARFVEGVCDDLGIPCHLESFDVPAYLKGSSLSPQEGAREVRSRLLAACAEKMGADRIAMGHNADDQVETFLMRLIQGAGLSGLSGIPPVSGKIIRPLIEVWRAEIERYCAVKGKKPRIDSSNLEPVYLRNRVRLALLPMLEQEFGAGVKEVLLREVEVLRRDSAFLEEGAREASRFILEENDGAVSLDRSKFLALPRSLQTRVLGVAWGSLRPEGKPLGYRQLVEVIDKVFGGASGAGIDLPGGMVARRDYNRVVICCPKGEEVATGEEVELEIPGQAVLPWAGIRVLASEVDRSEVSFSEDPYVEYIDIPSTESKLVLRPIRPGDRFYPLGVGGGKKVKDYFIDQKVPRGERRSAAVATCGDEIVWLVGHRLDERYSLRPGTGRVVRLVVEKGRLPPGVKVGEEVDL